MFLKMLSCRNIMTGPVLDNVHRTHWCVLLPGGRFITTGCAIGLVAGGLAAAASVGITAVLATGVIIEGSTRSQGAAVAIDPQLAMRNVAAISPAAMSFPAAR